MSEQLLDGEDEWLLHYYRQRKHRSHKNGKRWRPDKDRLRREAEELEEELWEQEEE